MFDPGDGPGLWPHDNVLLSATDGSLTQAPGVPDVLPSATGLYLPCRSRNETAGPPSFGPTALSGQQQDAGRAGNGAGRQ